MSEDIEARLSAVYEAEGNQARLNRAYDAWVDSYERDLWGSGNPYLALAAAFVARYVPDRKARILDGGCGPGGLALLLNLLGYRRITGIDASQGMVDAATRRGVYESVERKLLAEKMDLEASSFDAAVLSGVLTRGHVPPQALDGILEVVKPGAPVIFSMSASAYGPAGYKDKVEALLGARAWRLTEQTEPFQTYPFVEEYADLRHWISVYTKSEA